MSSDYLRVLLPCDGAPIPSELAAREWTRTQPLTSRGDVKDINIAIESLYGKVFGEIDGRAADLIRIATYCYVADQFITRGGPADVHRDHWRRSMTLCIGVNDPGFWNSGPVMNALTAALAFATDDEWTFAFSQVQAMAGVSQLPLAFDSRELLDSPDSIVLFSGGTDSLCATVDAVTAGKKPLVISHTPANHIGARIDDLLENLREEYASAWVFPQLAFNIHRAKKEPESSSQRTRAFLYAALGAATALQLGVTEVILADNGYVSINPPISGQIVGATASHGTHPTFLHLMNRFLTNLGDRPPHVTNTLADSTRAEAFSRLNERGVASLLQLTHSCGRSLRKDGHPHCGYCSQCVDRRFAFLASGLAELDAMTTYVRDVFTEALPPGEARFMALSFVAFAQEMEALRDEQVLERYQELLEQQVGSGVQIHIRMLRVARLLKRHAAEVLTGLRIKIAEQSDAIARRQLPAECLLRLVLNETENEIATFEEGAQPRVDSLTSPSVVPIFDIEKNRTVVSILWNQPPPEHYRFSIGFERLRLLILNPGKAISALQLQQMSAGTKTSDDIWQEFKPIIDGFHPDDRGKLDPLIPNERLAELRQKRDELAIERADAIARGNLRAAERYDTQRREIMGLLKKASNLYGRERPDPTDPREKARKNVSRTIHLAIDEIGAYQEDLAMHLLETLHIGLYCTYHPETPLLWRSAA
jgi:7-cyano-7-deazaguanine synthase in queuosine biosynthesis